MQNEEWSLRPATTEDLDEVSRIEKAVYPIVTVGTTAPWSEGQFREELAKPYSQFLVLTDNETDIKIAGYLVSWILFDECQVLNIAVDLPYRGLGFAKLMLHKCVQIAVQKNLKRVTLEVRKSNLPAIQLYQKMQFVITHVRKGFYSNGEDAYHMTLLLEGDSFQF